MSQETVRLYILINQLSQEQIEDIWNEAEQDLKMSELNYESDDQIHMFGFTHTDQLTFLDVLRANHAPFHLEEDSYECAGHVIYFDGYTEKYFDSGIKDYEARSLSIIDFIALSNVPVSKTA